MHVPGVYNTVADALSHSSITEFSPFVQSTTNHHGTSGPSDPGLDLPGVDSTVQTLIGRGLSARSHASYRTGIICYLRFCQRFSLLSLPLSQLNLLPIRCLPPCTEPVTICHSCVPEWGSVSPDSVGRSQPLPH